MPNPDFAKARKVSSVPDEGQIVHATPCSCGGTFTIKAQQLLRDPATQLHYDLLETACIQCGAQKEFLFDINSFFGKATQDSSSTPTSVQSPGVPTYASLTFALRLSLAMALLGLAALLFGLLVEPSASNASDQKKAHTAGLLLFIGFGVTAEMIRRKRARICTPPQNFQQVQREMDGVHDEVEGVLKRHGIELNWGTGDPKAALIGGSAKAALHRGCKSLDANQPDEAIASISPAIATLERENLPAFAELLASAFALRGSAYEKKLLLVEARADYQSALKLVPQHTQARVGLARLS